MKEQMYTIPLMDAYRSDDECPFCFIERKLEQHSIYFVLGPGASYMEDDIRAQTDQTGFCRTHFQKMYDYGNRLGSALILSTHMKKKNKELADVIKHFSPGKPSALGRFKKIQPGASAPKTSIGQWVRQQEEECYVCNYYKNTYARYLDTFFELYRKDPEFVQLVKDSKGLCIHHFGDLVESAEEVLSAKEKKDFYDVILPLMEANMKRVQEDVEWFCAKFDYKNKDADWKNSRDSIQRSMQKMAGGHPADPPYQQDK